MNVDVVGALSDLAARRPVFHSERDFQHALAWQIQLNYPLAEIRLETRPRRSVHLDMLIRLDGTRTVVELKYLVAALHATIGAESFDLPHQSANDIRRHEIIKDITRIEAALADGHADNGCVVVLTNDRSYWQPATRADTIDAAFRLHEGRILEGTVAWGIRAGPGTTTGRDAPLLLADRYTCHWRNYSQVTLTNGRSTQFRYLLITDVPDQTDPAQAQAASPQATLQAQAVTAPPATASGQRARNGAREEILMAAKALADHSPDGSFTLMQVITFLRHAGSRYAESTIRTHVTSRMCSDAPDHHGTTYDDFKRLDAAATDFAHPGLFTGPPHSHSTFARLLTHMRYIALSGRSGCSRSPSWVHLSRQALRR